MSLLPKVPYDLTGRPKDYLVELVRRLERELWTRPARQTDGVMYMGFDQPYIFVDEDGNQYTVGDDLVPFTTNKSVTDLDAPAGDQVRFIGVDGVMANDPAASSGWGSVVHTGRSEGRMFQMFLDDDGAGNEPEIFVRSQGTSGWGAWRQVVMLDTLAGAGWVNLTFQNSWVNYGGSFPPAQYRVFPDGRVMLRGLVKDGTVGASTPVATLPVGARPTFTNIFTALCGGQQLARVDVGNDGGINPNDVPNNSYLSLNGISFYAEA